MVLNLNNAINIVHQMLSKITLNNLKSCLLVIIVSFGTFYTFNLEPASYTVLTIKRLVVLLFIYAELCNILLRRIKMTWFYFFGMISFAYICLLLSVNSGINQVAYFLISILFIISVISHFSRISEKNLYFFLKLLNYSLSLVVFIFLFLIFLVLFLDSENTKKLIIYGFGNDYSNFSVWVGYISLLIVYLEIRFKFAGKLTLIFLSILFLMVIIAGGRTGSIMIIGSFASYLFFTYRYSIRYLITKILLFLGVALFLSIYFGQNSEIVGRFSVLNTYGNSLFSVLDFLLSGRMTIFEGAINQFINNSNIYEKFFGLGISNFYVLHLEHPYQVHNFLFRYLMEIGIFGMVCFAALYFYPFFAKYHNGYKSLTIALYLVASLNAMVSPGSFFTGINVSAGIWVIVAMSTQMRIRNI